jgi:hypothetical protein
VCLSACGCACSTGTSAASMIGRTILITGVGEGLVRRLRRTESPRRADNASKPPPPPTKRPNQGPDWPCRRHLDSARQRLAARDAAAATLTRSSSRPAAQTRASLFKPRNPAGWSLFQLAPAAPFSIGLDTEHCPSVRAAPPAVIPCLTVPRVAVAGVDSSSRLSGRSSTALLLGDQRGHAVGADCLSEDDRDRTVAAARSCGDADPRDDERRSRPGARRRCRKAPEARIGQLRTCC